MPQQQSNQEKKEKNQQSPQYTPSSSRHSLVPLENWRAKADPDECREERGLAKRPGTYLDQSLERLAIPKSENTTNILRHGL